MSMAPLQAVARPAQRAAERGDPGEGRMDRPVRGWSAPRSAGAAAAGTDGAPTALGAAARRANAGPHAASLAGLRAVVAQRACPDCEHARRAMHASPPLPSSGTGVAQRVLILRGKSEQGKRTLPVLLELADFYENEAALDQARGHPLTRAVSKRPESERLGIVRILLGWAESAEEWEYRDWTTAVKDAVAEHSRRAAEASETPEERERRAAERDALARAMPSAAGSGAGAQLPQEELDAVPDDKVAAAVDEFRRSASLETDRIHARADAPPGIKRRKADKRRENLADEDVGHRTYRGHLVFGKQNLLQGRLAEDYAGLLQDLTAEIDAEYRRDGKQPLGDDQVADLFMAELNGQHAFGSFSPQTQALAHKVVAIILNAELSRHSLAPVAAAAAFHGVANPPGPDKRSLAGAFGTGSRDLRVLFGGAGGAARLRGKDDPTARDQAQTRRAWEDIMRYRAATGLPEETLFDFVGRRTGEIVSRAHGLSPLAGLDAADPDAADGALADPDASVFAAPLAGLGEGPDRAHEPTRGRKGSAAGDEKMPQAVRFTGAMMGGGPEAPASPPPADDLAAAADQEDLTGLLGRRPAEDDRPRNQVKRARTERR